MSIEHKLKSGRGARKPHLIVMQAYQIGYSSEKKLRKIWKKINYLNKLFSFDGDFLEDFFLEVIFLKEKRKKGINILGYTIVFIAL